MSQEHLKETEETSVTVISCPLDYEGTCDCCWLGFGQGEDWRWVLVGFSLMLLILLASFWVSL